jgi:hypothetical protein
MNDVSDYDLLVGSLLKTSKPYESLMDQAWHSWFTSQFSLFVRLVNLADAFGNLDNQTISTCKKLLESLFSTDGDFLWTKGTAQNDFARASAAIGKCLLQRF